MPSPGEVGDDPFDILVVGGGPVGLHAALKAAVLNQKVAVVDKGRRFSRLAQAPEIANLPGCDPPMSGEALLERSREKIEIFEAQVGKRLVTFLDGWEAVGVEREAEGAFRLHLAAPEGQGAREIVGRTLVLATGLVDRKPGIGRFARMGHETLAPYVRTGELGYCILCEGWAVEGKRIAVVGATHASADIAIDLSAHFGANATLLTDGARLAEARDERRVREARVRVDETPIASLADDGGALGVAFKDGRHERFEKAFLALGWYKVNNELAVALGAKTTRDGYVVTDENSEVLDREGRTITGLFAVGDLRAGRWKQLVIGWGDAETAVITAYADRLHESAHE